MFMVSVYKKLSVEASGFLYLELSNRGPAPSGKGGMLHEERKDRRENPLRTLPKDTGTVHQGLILQIALDSPVLFADNNPQHLKGNDRGKYVRESRQRRVEQWLKLPPGRT